MAEPDTPAVRAAGAVNGRVPKRDADAIVAEIERTRESLARTIDSLTDRVSPASNMRRVRERAGEQLARPQVQAALAAAALVVTAYAVYRIFSGRDKS